MDYVLTDIAEGAARVFEGHFDTSKFAGRVRHLAANGLIKESGRESEHPNAAKVFSPEEACLGALLLWSTEILDFEIETQTLIVQAIRRAARKSSPSSKPSPGVKPAFDLARAVQGVRKGEKWTLRLDIRLEKSATSRATARVFRARFVKHENARPNEASERLLSAKGASLFGTVLVPLSDLFAPFASGN